MKKHRYLAVKLVEYDLILGYDWLKEVNLDINWESSAWYYRDVPEPGVTVTLAGLTQEPQLPPQFTKFATVFGDPDEDPAPSRTKVRHFIPLEEGQTAPYGPIYPLSAKELRVLREYIETAMGRGWIQPSESGVGALILFVPKKDGSLRLCVDYRGLNRVTKKNRYPLPLIPKILDRLVGARVYTKLDLKDAYHRIPIAEEDRWKTAFPYINEALKGLLDEVCVAFMDDILIFSPDEAVHEAHVNLVLERLKEHGLYANLSKCKFFTTEVDFLGFRVGTVGVSMDPRFANFYRGFIHRYSAVVAPITDLLIGMKAGKKTGTLIWTEEADAAFRTLKARFSEAPMLAHFDPERRNRVETDASGQALGGVLS
ncbi:hypothetical protein AYO21_09814 [Fonsecaea monophora]|uniref:Reverse transcriptase domain-containing protein n=1 Tax=Fonsecaea monophora TaxID=254056 RepID=A0A177EXB9_9EURO|nr:hypothetical protein AYO21_09814 [Fonsecaea monophora]OAG36021.1 hypothetical protein AYO21_09814 [Fonsecaea monophora]